MWPGRRCGVGRGPGRQAEDAAAAKLLLLAAHWADLHPATAGALDGTPVGRGLDGRERLIPLAGEGTPGVAEFACAELAAALRISTESGKRLVGDSLELRHRLPRLWARVMAGDLPAWRARRIAQQTTWLTRQAAYHVDRHLAPFAHKVSLGRVEKMVAAAAAEFMPDEAKQRAEQAADRRHVTLHDDTSLQGTAHIEIETDALDAQAFDHTIGALAGQLGAFGDTNTLDVRRAKAIGVIADPQGTLDLLSVHPDRSEAKPPIRKPAKQVVLHLHLSEAAVTGTAAASTGDAVVSTSSTTGEAVGSTGLVLGRRETTRCGGDLPMLADQIRAWCGRQDVNLTVHPVLDLAEKLSADAYEIPDRIAEHVNLRDRTCVFPLV